MLLHEREQLIESTPGLDPELLIEEARRRGRRRRLAWATIIIAAAGGLIAFAATKGGSNDPNQPATADAGGGIVKSIDLARSGPYESLALVDGRLILSGGPDGSLFASATIASAPHSPVSKVCHSAVVNPATLKLTDQRAGACEDPALYGVRVVPVNDAANGQGYRSTVRIAHTNASVRGYTVGPVVMRYEEASDTDAEWVYGDGYLWIYDPMTTSGSELLQVSLTSGAVLDRIPMPVITRPLLATNDDGLWIVPAITSSFTDRPALALYHIKPGAKAAVIAAKAALGSPVLAHWLVADGHTVWVEVNHEGKPSTLWQLQGAAAQPASHHSASSALDYVEFGYGESEYGADSSALWAVVPGNGQRVIRINPSTGHLQRVATIKPPAGYEIQTLQPPLVVENGEAFFLDSPAQAGTYPYHRGGFSALYRIETSR